MNNHVSRVMYCFFRNNLYTFNRRAASTLLTFNQEGENGKNRKYNHYYGYTLGATFGIALGIVASCEEKKNTIFGSPRSELPDYKMEEVAKHNDKKTRIWVTYRHGVYDITDFVGNHPGGDVILLAAGGSLDPFWNLYGVHKQEHILELLEEFRIGNLHEEVVHHSLNENDPYAWEPVRHPALKPSSNKPFNAEPPPELLIRNHITPQELFFVRNHLPVPDIDPETYQLELTGEGLRTITFSLDELKKMPRHTVTSTIMCAGNRRSEMSQVKPVKGLNWGHAAIGTAEWTGVRLCDLLHFLKVTENSKALHVQFEGLDYDATNTPYGASIPLASALDPKAEVLVAYEMNGEPLSRDHGFPVRIVAPGIAGARNVKWLNRIVVSECESDSHWQQNDYKGFCPNVTWDNVDFSKSPAIQELPVISAICVPAEGEIVKLNRNNTVTVRGYAWSGGGHGIVRVDLTADGGSSWYTANLIIEKEAKPGQRVWDWTLWEADLPVPEHSKDELIIWAKAIDSAYNTQPENFSNIWNLRGVLNNAYHKVKINISK